MCRARGLGRFMSGVNEIRKTFLEFFAKNGHEIVASSPLVPRNDPTLMFTNAGMVQFKNVFTGLEKRPYSRAVTSQKCVRAGGKHNDLDNVGYTARHHTFFEMLGNFSFGDYFKEQAISLAWELVTKEYGLPADRLLVTVYADDEDAASLWRRIAGLPDSKIIRIATSDNFWRMGDVGPCGPCSEIFYDHGDHIPGGPPGSPDQDGDRFIEIWNLVFMQFEEQLGGTRLSLPRPSIDTGMGLERISAVLQGTHDNYETDLMRALIRAGVEATGVEAIGVHKPSHRVIADHLRASAFLVADGVLPSNEGRGYVLRRIMRRAMRHASLLGARDPLLHKLVGALTREMGQAYPELLRAESLITETLLLEETRFRKTLERGLAILDGESRGLGSGAVFSGATAFTLYDTYGFPLDLTQDALRSREITVDVSAFEAAMAEQKTRARAAWSGSGDAATDTIWFGLREELGATEFLGYSTESAEGVAVALVREGARIESLKTGETGYLLANQTPFYGESGGQVGDSGTISGDGFELSVLDTQKRVGDLLVHQVRVDKGQVSIGSALVLKVDHARRSAIRANHSATHLLHEALRLVLGDHVAQKGSLVSADRLRFDISHPKPISQAELDEVEAIANRVLLENSRVTTRLMPVDDAIASGARALFGEKYGDEVRVVSMGEPAEGSRSSGWSVELCGGTHVVRTGDIGVISILGDSAVSAGVRRIEAVTGHGARHYLNQQSRLLGQVASLLRVSPQEASQRLETVLDERRKMERELNDARKKLAMAGPSSGGGDQIKQIGPVGFIGKIVSGIEMRDVKGLADEAKSRLTSGVVALVAKADDGKASLVVAVTPDLTARFDAVSLVRSGVEVLGGKGGGGRPDMAQGGGPDSDKAEAVIAMIEAQIAAAH